jgi:transposase-like protein
VTFKPLTKEELASFDYHPFTSGAKCAKCGSLDRWWTEIGDGTYEDYRYRCNGCGDTYVVEGSDY